MPRLAVLASGSGTILEAIAANGIDVAVVVCDRECRALQVGKDLDVDTELLDRHSYGGFSDAFDRESYTDALVKILQSHSIDVVAMAGFGTVLGPSAYEEYSGKIMNTHPALLPAFPGWHAVEDALKAGVKVTGCTVHIATPEVDAGPILAQRTVDVLEEDTIDSLHERIKQVEREIYPAAIRSFMEKVISLTS
ncbi:MAG: phosphoribosylglycinamide formyltransferase [Acidimicrobiales bacterium]